MTAVILNFPISPRLLEKPLLKDVSRAEFNCTPRVLLSRVCAVNRFFLLGVDGKVKDNIKLFTKPGEKNRVYADVFIHPDGCFNGHFYISPNYQLERIGDFWSGPTTFFQEEYLKLEPSIFADYNDTD